MHYIVKGASCVLCLLVRFDVEIHSGFNMLCFMDRMNLVRSHRVWICRGKILGTNVSCSGPVTWNAEVVCIFCLL